MGVVGVAGRLAYFLNMHSGDILEETNLVVRDRRGDNVVVGQAAESLGVSDRSDGS